jgi:hypothetical protein
VCVCIDAETFSPEQVLELQDIALVRRTLSERRSALLLLGCARSSFSDQCALCAYCAE